MKTVLVLLATFAFAAAVQIVDPLASRSLSSEVESAIEDIRDQMPCGFPGVGIPPLAPFKLEHQEIDINYPALQLYGSVSNFRLNGLNDFEISEMKVNAILSKVTYKFDFRNVNVDTLYDLSLLLKKAGFTINLIGNGKAKFAIKDMTIWGTMKYSLGVLSGKLKLKTMEVRTHIGEVYSDIEGILGEGNINNRFNDVLAEAVELAVNENENYITETLEAMALPMVNNALNDVSVIDIISSGSDDEKETCIPPEL